MFTVPMFQTDSAISFNARGQPYQFHVVIESYSSLQLKLGPPSWKADKNTVKQHAFHHIKMDALSLQQLN